MLNPNNINQITNNIKQITNNIKQNIFKNYNQI